MKPIRIEVPQFVRVVKMSEKQKAQYFDWNGAYIKGKNKTLPVKFYLDKDKIKDKPTLNDLKAKYSLGHLIKGKIEKVFLTHETTPKEIDSGKIVLCEIIGNKVVPIIRNPKKVGQPRNYLIKGQDIYNGYLNPFSRGKVMDAIKKCYFKAVNAIPVITEYPIGIEVEFHHPIHNPYDKKGEDGLGQAWDIDNFVYPYMKAFPDLLVQLGKIKNDDRLHLTKPPHVTFYPVDTKEEMKFVFIISKDDRIEIRENEIFKSYHKNKETFETEDSDLCKDDEPFEKITNIPLTYDIIRDTIQEIITQKPEPLFNRFTPTKNNKYIDQIGGAILTLEEIKKLMQNKDGIN